MDFVPAHPRDVEFQATPILSRPMSPRANNDVESTMTSAEKSMTAAPDAPHAGAEAALHHQAPPSKVLIPVLVLAAFGLYLASLAPQIVTLAVRIAGVDPDGKTIGLSAVLLAGAVVSIASLPVFGALSDRTRGRYGRRRPWFVGGAAMGLLGLVIAGSMPSVAGIAIGWGIASLGYGAAFAGFLPLIPNSSRITCAPGCPG